MRIVAGRQEVGPGERAVHVVYHSADLDGIASAAVVLEWLRRAGGPGDGVLLHGLTYGEAFPWSAVRSGDRVYMVDFSLPAQDMARLQERCAADVETGVAGGGMHWYDHHATALDEVSPDLLGRRNTRLAACEIAAQELLGYVPLPVYLLGRYDVWDHAAALCILEFQYGCRILDLQPTSECWAFLLADVCRDENQRRLVDSWVRDRVTDGTAVLKYARQERRRTVQAGAHLVTLAGVAALACNAAGGSELFREAAPELLAKADVLLTYVFNGRRQEWVCGLYHKPGREDVDCGALAKRFGGGGHRGASGFRCATRPWLEGNAGRVVE